MRGVFTTASRLPVRNGLFLVLVASSILGGLAELGITDPFTVVLLTTALGATAVRRVLDPAPARRCSPAEGAFATASGVAWLAIEFAAHQNAQGIAHDSFYVPTALRLAAAAVLFAEIFGPLIRARRAGSVAAGGGPMELSGRQLVVISAVCVASANLVFVALAAAWVSGLVVLRAPASIGARGGEPGVLAETRLFARP